jgi:hypothetical protein
VQLYEIFKDDNVAVHRIRTRYEEALGQFEQGDFDSAAATIGNLLVDELGDGPSLLLMSRIVSNLLDSSESFDPVWTLPGK